MDRLTHLDESGAARMVDVSGKDVTARVAVATGKVLVSAEVVALLRPSDGRAESRLPKGDALGVARLAGIMGAKKTPELIPLCHPLAISGVTVDLEVHDDGVAIRATVKTTDRTGVEMEALTAVAVAALTVIDMVKAVDKGAVITDVRVESKEGGKSGTWRRSVPERASVPEPVEGPPSFPAPVEGPEPPSVPEPVEGPPSVPEPVEGPEPTEPEEPRS